MAVLTKPWCVVPKEVGAPASRIGIALGANALTPRGYDLIPGTWARDLTTTALAMITSQGPRVEVADRSLVLGGQPGRPLFHAHVVQHAADVEHYRGRLFLAGHLAGADTVGLL